MKNIIITFVTTLIIFYLIGCFVSVSFNIAEWKEGSRFFIAFAGVLLSVAFSLFTHDVIEKNKNNSNE